MVALVFVRSMADLHSSVDAVNAFLLFRRARGGRAQDEEIAGIWVSGDLGAGLPGRYQGEEGSREDRTGARVSDTGAEVGLTMYESCELAGVWGCGWLDGPLVSGAHGAAERRDAIVRALTEARLPLGVSTGRGVFLPVFGADEPLASLAAEVRTLRARYPHTIGSGWFCLDPTRGLVAGAPVSDGVQ
jgi:hypothetical protein